MLLYRETHLVTFIEDLAFCSSTFSLDGDSLVSDLLPVDMFEAVLFSET